MPCDCQFRCAKTSGRHRRRDSDHKLYLNLEKRFAALELKLEHGEGGKSPESLLQNDTNLEERVKALEFQMENVHEDMTVIEGEISAINF